MILRGAARIPKDGNAEMEFRLGMNYARYGIREYVETMAKGLISIPSLENVPPLVNDILFCNYGSSFLSNHTKRDRR